MGIHLKKKVNIEQNEIKLKGHPKKKIKYTIMGIQ